MVPRDTLEFVVNHVFMPPKLPQEDDSDRVKEIALVQLVLDTARVFSDTDITDKPEWFQTVEMIENFLLLQDSSIEPQRCIDEMLIGDSRVFYIRAQNAAIILSKLEDHAVFEAFEVLTPRTTVLASEGKLIRSFPGPAIRFPLRLLDDTRFTKELAGFIAQMNVEPLDSAATIIKAGSTVTENREPADPRYIITLLTGILRGLGKPEEVERVTKRMGDEVLINGGSPLCWRRSPVWLVLRVALQTTLARIDPSHAIYKTFMISVVADVLEKALLNDWNSETLFCMNVKLRRRIARFDADSISPAVTNAQSISADVTEALESRWKVIQAAQATSPQWAPDELDLSMDTLVSMKASRPVIEEAIAHEPTARPPVPFQPANLPRLFRNFKTFELRFALETDFQSTVKDAFGSQPLLALADFETSVRQNLSIWTLNHLDDSGATKKLLAYAQEYQTCAQKLYRHKPEDWSLMHLCLFEIWVAIDKIATTQCPLLKEYPPPFPLHVLDPILVRKKEDIQQLEDIRQHILDRHTEASQPRGVFTNKVTTDTFGVRYFDDTVSLQQLMRRIETQANKERQEAIVKMKEKNREHKRLRSEMADIGMHDDHPMVTEQITSRRRRNNYATVEDRSKCRLCILTTKAEALRVDVHEWPLPEDPDLAKHLVFELAPPPVFAHWRTVTFSLMKDIIMIEVPEQPVGAPPRMHLESYEGLKDFRDKLVPTDANRISLTSDTKAFEGSRYDSIPLPTTEEAVCVNHGLSWSFHDRRRWKWMGDDPFPECDISKHCTLQLSPDKRYDGLQYAVDGVTHTPNQSLASQSKCPANLTIHEFLAFTGLRSGARLQWLNIVRELRAGNLTFHREQVHLLVMQAAWQAGKVDEEGKLGWHVDLESSEFGIQLLSELDVLLTSISGSWKEGITARTIILLVSRLLASAIDDELFQQAYDLLRRARAITLEWLHQLVLKLQDCPEDSIREAQLRICDMALTCRATFEVANEHLSKLLESEDDIAIFAECAILLHDNSPRSNIPADLQRVLDRDRRLAHQIQDRFLDSMELSNGLDRAVAAVWVEYRSGSSWTFARNSSWVTATTEGGYEQPVQTIHLNVLNGQLLIDGKPLGRLPAVILKHPHYVRIFGEKRILDIIPSNKVGMEYATMRKFSGYQVFFDLQDNGKLVIRADHSDTMGEFQLIAHEHFQGDLPTLLVNEHVHWLDLLTHEIELRPKEDCWTSSPDNWRIDVSGPHWNMKRSKSLLVDIHSASFRMLASQVNPLEYDEFIEVTQNIETDALHLELPRFGLSFFVNEDRRLECVNMPKMVVDSNRSTGTMFGLVNQLVLVNSTALSLGLPSARHVLVPFGEITAKTDGNHVTVSIDTKAQRRVPYFDYAVDRDLRRLVGSASQLCRLFQIHLHALTSHCLPDPLLGATGTEEALNGLNSSFSLSFQSLGDEERKVLDLIAALSPGRFWSPIHARIMQSVAWKTIPVLSQHAGFSQAVKRILDYADDLAVFDETKKKRTTAEERKRLLLAGSTLTRRAASRNGIFYSGDLPQQVVEDLVVSSHGFSEKEEIKVSRLAGRIFAGDIIPYKPEEANGHRSLDQIFKGWNRLHDDTLKLGLSYHPDWTLKECNTFWMSLYDICRDSRASKEEKKFQLLFSLCAMSYSKPDRRHLIPYIIAFSQIDDFEQDRMASPATTNSDLSIGIDAHSAHIRSILIANERDLSDTPAAALTKGDDEASHVYRARRKAHYDTNQAKSAAQIVAHVSQQWTNDPRGTIVLQNAWLRYHKADLAEKLQYLFRRCNQNRRISRYAANVQVIFDDAVKARRRAKNPHPYQFPSAPQASLDAKSVPLSLSALLRRRDAPDETSLPQVPRQKSWTSRGARELRQRLVPAELKKLLRELRQNASLLQLQYADDLQKSQTSLNSQSTTKYPEKLPDMEMILGNCEETREHYEAVFEHIATILGPETVEEKMMGLTWPSVTERVVLRLLSASSTSELPAAWKPAIIAFGRAFLKYQQSLRLLIHARAENTDDFYKELANVVSEKHCVEPEWILIQIEGNFLARSLQLDLAKEMISPSSQKNSVFQLTMGEGKTSVIVPLVISALANGQRLVRVVVLKSLSTQMYQSLLEKVSTLPNRRLFYMPFSRKLVAGAPEIKAIQNMYESCMAVGGILVTQPEHILSYRLMAIDRLLTDGDPIMAALLLKSVKWLDSHSRDVHDESDEILHVRYQLIYTIGQQGPLEGHPDRWCSTQELFSLINKHLPFVAVAFPEHVIVHEEHGTDGSFRRIQVSNDPKCAAALVKLIADDILDNGALSTVHFRLSADIRQVTYAFITSSNVSQEDLTVLYDYFGRSNAMWKHLLLLRGLLSQGILVYILSQKRWRVDYGLDLSRSMLAVPYRAKDLPSPRAEFGHPDVAIGLTCLSYYYAGLTNEQLGVCFHLLWKHDNPALEYEGWVRHNTTLPVQYRQLSGINTADQEQFVILAQHFSRTKAVVDFYLAGVVFPKAAKEFPQKLGTSGWDLAEEKNHLTTGFSGTNDNKYLLPTSISQEDPIGQGGTNAKIITFLLQPENNAYQCMPSFEITAFLQVLHQKNIRVLLDVGAQMLDMRNKELVKRWLDLTDSAAAALFFNDADELIVLSRDGTTEPFISSPFRNQLDKCLVYLDDAHTRGTDLKLPRNYRAAVTLGRNVTKDRLVQGCMRMRKLGHGQSVMFFASPDIDRRIRNVAKTASVQAIDIVKWCILETCGEIEHFTPHWADQGLDYSVRSPPYRELLAAPEPAAVIESMKTAWLQSEARSLDSMYDVPIESSSRTEQIMAIPALGEKLRSLGIMKLEDVNREEEQEREVGHEVEREREVQRPRAVAAHDHLVDPALMTFISKGLVPAKTFQPLWSIFPSFKMRQPEAPKIFVTRDFRRTVQEPNVKDVHDYLRPVNWVLQGKSAGGIQDAPIVIISPFEANTLLPRIRNSSNVQLHSYAPRVLGEMKSFDDFDFYCIPANRLPTIPSLRMRTELNLFAGQLYFSSFEAYKDLCRYLQVLPSGGGENDGTVWTESDGFLRLEYHALKGCASSPFSESPVPFLKELIGSRRKGNGYAPTHLGRLLQGRAVSRDDFGA
ncbi:hypothetical protein C8J56DRAFT_462654 [Mycena floridula]|nr:hypothetical protein C8J56DRAFT_462654 [Mycena floridula]